MRIDGYSLGSMLASAGTAMVALTGIALVVVTSSFDGIEIGKWQQLVLMIGASSCATIFIMGLLHGDLRKYYEKLAIRERSALREARTDTLTRLPNRKALIEDLRAAIKNAEAGETQDCLVIADLDEFKNVNDTLGHEAGDALLKIAASKLNSILAPDHGVYRLGGDEFALILKSCDLREAAKICANVQDELSGSHTIGTKQARVGCSLGISEIVSRSTASDMLRRSDFAMYQAKFKRGSVSIFDGEMRDQFVRRA